MSCWAKYQNTISKSRYMFVLSLAVNQHLHQQNQVIWSKSMVTKFYQILQTLANNKYKRSLLYLDQNSVALHIKDPCCRHSIRHTVPTSSLMKDESMGKWGGLPMLFFSSWLSSLPAHYTSYTSPLHHCLFTSILTQSSKLSSLKLGTMNFY